MGNHRWISYHLETVHAGPDYPGYYRDLDFKSARVSLPLWKTLKVNAYYRDDRQNLDLNPVFHSAPQRNYYQLGLSYKPWRRTGLSLDYWNRVREDRLPDPDFDFSEETLRFTLAQSFKTLALWASVDVGEKADKLTGQTGPLEEYSFSASWKPTSGQSYRAYLQFSQEAIADDDWRRITGGLNASFQLGRANSLAVNYQRSNYEGRSSMGRDQVDLQFAHRFRNHHQLSICGRYVSRNTSFRSHDTAALVAYEIPFGLPVSRKKSTGILKGRVYDAENPERLVPRAIVRLSELTAVTDRKGNFTFGSLKPGDYYLALDKASIGMDRVTVEKSPIKIAVAGGKKNYVEVGVTRSASLTGRVVVYRPVKKPADANPLREPQNAASFTPGDANSAESEMAESYPLPNILVELRNPSETLRRMTDRKGRFTFEEVRPGKWTLKIYNVGLPEHHYLERDTFTFELKPADKKNVQARVLPKKRRIQIIEEGGVLEEQ